MTQIITSEGRTTSVDPLADLGDASEDSRTVPLVVDLDETVLKTDLLHEALLRIAKRRPLALLTLLFYLQRGRAAFKQKVAEIAELDISTLPLNREVVAWLREEKQKGRRLALATAANQSLAERVANEMGLFDFVIGSTAECNLKGKNKLVAIQQNIGDKFDYVGNSSADVEIWKACRHAFVVSGEGGIERKARAISNVVRVFPGSQKKFGLLSRVIRLYQWSKNVLIFVPAFTSHTILNPTVALECLVAFVAFSLVASGAYIFNDLLDLEEDRQSSVKRFRALASGECSIRNGVILSAFCFVLAFGISAATGLRLFVALVFYAVLTLTYSLNLKKVLVLDVITLATLYTLRIIMGHVVTGIAFSMWLLSFSFFLFLSLALCKRAAELVHLEREGQDKAPGRGYAVGDLRIINTAGISSGLVSSLVLALYINSSSVTLLYRRPIVLWGVLPLLIFYILRIWLICGRGELDADPIIYTAESRSTYYIATVVVLLVVLATARF